MSTADKLQRLLSLCKCGVFVTVNQHRNYYQTAAQALEEARTHECPPQITDAVRAEMISRNTIVVIQFYPATPIGSYSIWHYDLDAALDRCLACFPDGGGSEVAASDPPNACHVCHDPTQMCCSDCAINFGASVYICGKRTCREEHDRKCFGDSP